MNEKPIAIVLGGTSAHLELISNLKGRGYYVVLVDYLENPPAKSVADEHIQESTLDKEKTLEIAQRLDAKLVINTCLDQPIQTACYVSEKLGLPTPYSYATSIKVTDKTLMKTIMRENNIPTSKFIIADEKTDINKIDLSFPLIVKPADGTGSLGVKKADNLKDLHRYLEEARRLSRSGSIIVEEFCEGDEWNIYFFIVEDKAHILMALRKYKCIDGYQYDSQQTDPLTQLGSIAQFHIPNLLKTELRNIAVKIASAFEIKTSPLLVQTIISKSGIHVLEFAARLGGTGSSNNLIKESTGIDIVDATIQAYLGMKPNVQVQESRSHFAINFVYASEGIFDRIEGVDELFRQKLIQQFHAYKSRNMKIGPEFSSRNRVGTFLVKAANEVELFQKIRKTVDVIDVIDINGKSIMRKDLFLKEIAN